MEESVAHFARRANRDYNEISSTLYE